jgi:Mg2+ and Co2+ transporter CorA
MRSKFARVAAVFVPLSFLGGLFGGNIGLAVGSAITWAVIFLIVRTKYIVKTNLEED